MVAKIELGEDESICYYENDRITPIFAIICRLFEQTSGMAGNSGDGVFIR